MSNFQGAAVPVTPHADDELLSMEEVADVARVPVATLRYWRHLGTGPRSFRIGRSVRYWRTEVFAWLTTRQIATARASSDFAEPRGSRRVVLRREHEHERAWPGEATT
jgi:predicted DNA-binding transcriptional regulator AlpA